MTSSTSLPRSPNQPLTTTWFLILIISLLLLSKECACRGGRGGGGRGGGARTSAGGSSSRGRGSFFGNSRGRGVGGAKGGGRYGDAQVGVFSGLRLWSPYLGVTNSNGVKVSKKFKRFMENSACAARLRSRPHSTFYYACSGNETGVVIDHWEADHRVCHTLISSDDIIESVSLSIAGDGDANFLDYDDDDDDDNAAFLLDAYFPCAGKCCGLDCCRLNMGLVVLLSACAFFAISVVTICLYWCVTRRNLRKKRREAVVLAGKKTNRA